MSIEIGRIEALYRYPVKSMRGEAREAATLGWHGLEGDRRFAFRRLDARGEFPWLTASQVPALVLYAPRRGDEDGEELPTLVRTPEGEDLELLGDALAAQIAGRTGGAVQAMQLKHGVFDEFPISVITSATVREVSRLAGTSADARRFRPNILVRSTRAVPFEEDDWVGSVLTFGESRDAPGVAVTMRDVRCAMVNIDPDRGTISPEMLKAVVRQHENTAGIYATVTRVGRLAVGQPIVLHR